MYIEKVEIENWKKFNKLKLNFSPGINIIYGKNEAGKTSVIQALYFAFVKDSQSNDKIIQEIVPWGTTVKPSVNLYFVTHNNNSYKIEKTFLKGESALLLKKGKKYQKVAEGKKTNTAIWDIIGVNEESLSLLDLLWVFQGNMLSIFQEDISLPVQEIIKNAIRENLFHGETEKFYRLIVDELYETFTEKDRVKKSSVYYNLMEEEKEKREKLEAIREKLEEFEMNRHQLDTINERLTRKQEALKVKEEGLKLLEAKKMKIDELKTLKMEFRNLKESYEEILHIQEEERQIREILPFKYSAKKNLLGKSLEEYEAKLVSIREDMEELKNIENEINKIPSIEYGKIAEWEKFLNNKKELEIQIEASRLRLGVIPGKEIEYSLSFDEGKEEIFHSSEKKEFTAQESFRFRYKDELELVFLGPISKEALIEKLRLLSDVDKRLESIKSEYFGIDFEQAKRYYQEKQNLLQREKILEERLGQINLKQIEKEIERLKKDMEVLKQKNIVGDNISEEGTSLEKINTEIVQLETRLEESQKRISKILEGRELSQIAVGYNLKKEEVQELEKKIREMKPFTETYIDEAAIKSHRYEIEEIRKTIHEYEKEKVEKETKIIDIGNIEDQLKDAEYEYNEALEKLKREKKRILSLQLLKTLMDEERAKLDKNILIPLQEKISEVFRKITQQRYSEVLLHDNLSINKLSARTIDGSVTDITPHILSGGTREQLSFIIRFAIALYLSQKEKQVLILDDSLVNTDVERLSLLLEWMKENDSEIQMLIFTCRKEAFENYKEGINWIELK